MWLASRNNGYIGNHQAIKQTLQHTGGKTKGKTAQQHNNVRKEGGSATNPAKASKQPQNSPAPATSQG